MCGVAEKEGDVLEHEKSKILQIILSSYIGGVDYDAFSDSEVLMNSCENKCESMETTILFVVFSCCYCSLIIGTIFLLPVASSLLSKEHRFFSN